MASATYSAVKAPPTPQSARRRYNLFELNKANRKRCAHVLYTKHKIPVREAYKQADIIIAKAFANAVQATSPKRNVKKTAFHVMTFICIVACIYGFSQLLRYGNNALPLVGVPLFAATMVSIFFDILAQFEKGLGTQARAVSGFVLNPIATGHREVYEQAQQELDAFFATAKVRQQRVKATS